MNITAIALNFLNWGAQLANSNFITALAGAGAGALGAQWIADRNSWRTRNIEEIRATNAAVMVAFGMVNTFCASKYQHVAPMWATFQKQKQQLEAYKERKKQGTLARGEAFEFEADFESYELPPCRVELLKALAFERVSATGRLLALVTTLSQTVESLERAVALRNGVIAHTKENPRNGEALAQLYFGLPSAVGRTDLTYPSAVQAIVSYADDCIWFTKTLIGDLVAHGRQLANAVGKGAPKVHEPEFSKAIELKLIPDDRLYERRLNAFKASRPTMADFR